MEAEVCTLRWSQANSTSFCLNYGSYPYDNNIVIGNSVQHRCKQKLGEMIDSCVLGSSLGKKPRHEIERAFTIGGVGTLESTWDLRRNSFSELTDCRCRSMQYSTIWTPVLWVQMDWASDLLLITLRVIHLHCAFAYYHVEERWELRYDQEDSPGEMSHINNKDGRSCCFLGNTFFFFLIKGFCKEDESMLLFNICGVFTHILFDSWSFI